MATYYVSPLGNNTNAGTELLPWATINYADLQTAPGDTIIIEQGPSGQVYNESVGVTDNDKTFIAKAGHKPVLDGGGTLTMGIVSNGRSGVVIDGLEVTRYTQRGIQVQASSLSAVGNNTVQNCHVHHLLTDNTALDPNVLGIYFAWGTGNKILSNHVHHIGNLVESKCIQTTQCDFAEVAYNEMHHARKEGFRDYQGRNTWTHDNRAYACWSGLSLNDSIGGLCENNFCYFNEYAVNPKHTNDDAQGALSTWGYTDHTQAEKIKIWHNTFVGNTWSGVQFGPNGPTNDLDIRNNIFAGPGSNYLWDASGSVFFRAQDHNFYQTLWAETDPWPTEKTFHLYHDGYDTNTGYYETPATLFAARGIDQNSQFITDFQFNDPANHDYDYPNTAPQYNAGQDLNAAAGRNARYGTGRGTQVGARGVPSARMRWTDIAMTTLSVKTAGSEPWLTYYSIHSSEQTIQADSTSEWVIFDLGVDTEINHLIIDQYTSPLTHGVSTFLLEKGDSASGPWTTITSGTFVNPDWTTPPPIEFPAVTARYLRWTGTSATADNVWYSNVRVGMLEEVSTGVEFIGYAQQDAQPGTAISVTKPTGVAEGDLLIFAVALSAGVVPTTIPTDAVQLTSATDSGNVGTTRVYTKVAGASEPATYDWAVGASQWWSVEMTVLRNASVPTLFAAATGSFTTTLSFPALTIPTPGGYHMLLGSLSGAGGAVTASPAEYLELTSTHYWPFWYGRANAPTGPTGTLTATYTTAQHNCGISIFVPLYVAPTGPQRPTASPYQVGQPARAKLNSRDAEILDYIDAKIAEITGG